MGFFLNAVNRKMGDYSDEEIKLKFETEIIKVVHKIPEQSDDWVQYYLLSDVRQVFPHSNNICVGSYTLHPFDSKKLVLLEHYHKNLASEKDDELIYILGLMGAKRVVIVEQEYGKKTININVEASVMAFRGSSSIGIDKQFSIYKSIEVLFQGQSDGIKNDILDKSLWFKYDNQVKYLLECRLNKHNPIKQYTLQNTYSDSYNFDFRISAGMFSVKCDFEREFEELSSIERYFHVEFV